MRWKEGGKEGGRPGLKRTARDHTVRAGEETRHQLIIT